MSLPAPINWMEDRDYPRFVVFGYNRSEAISGSWWSHRTPDHLQRFFATLEEAKNWVAENYQSRGFGRDNSGQARGELRTYSVPSGNRNEKWVPRVKIIQELFGYGELVMWYGSTYVSIDKAVGPSSTKTQSDKAQWWIFRLKD